jgi:ureidoglycolate dehydrogenase (NAD+)
MTKPVVVPAAALRSFAAAILEHAGLPAADAGAVADTLLWANLRGVDSHGVSRLPRYLEMIGEGVIEPHPLMQVVEDAPAVALLDAGRAAGALAMQRAAELALAKAAAAGIGLAMVRNTSHTGAIGYYAQRMARAGMAAIGFNASIPMMAYHGTRAAAVSTAPLTIAVPGPADDPVLLDMSTGAIALGKLVQARRAGTPLAAGLALDAEGNPTTDPAKAQIPLPLGGPKGAGLALMIELVASVATGNPILADYLTAAPGGKGKHHRQNALLIAIDVFRFCGEATFRADVGRTIAAIKAMPADVAVGTVLAPGERGDLESVRRSIAGIPVPPGIRAELATAAAAAGVAVPWPAP